MGEGSRRNPETMAVLAALENSAALLPQPSDDTVARMRLRLLECIALAKAPPGSGPAGLAGVLALLAD